MSDEIRRGHVVFLKWTNDQTRYYGFITPVGSSGSRESNIWFGDTVVKGPMPVYGDEVEFVKFDRPHPVRNTINARLVWKLGERHHVA
ncbi:hypothetical protein [Bradyrhizobium genosp. P]|uniref:hypothetical protein n=1 Tax=Bradyrhizobium genosp. P TaxID=83641 RepID=UPI003CF3B91F